MSLRFNKVSKDLLNTIKESPKKGTTPYDSVAEVVRIDGDTAWVHIAGGVDETPVSRTIDCKEGDMVQIRVGGGTAWITGNSTAPPTDDTKANVAYNYAETASNDALRARQSAINAENEAERAYVAANSAQASANSAQASADSAQTSANNALASAVSANNSANNALTQLSTVEDVVDVLNWISEHGTYKVSTDTEVVAGKFYFTRTGSGTTADPYVYTVVANPTGNPSTRGYYELDSVDEAISNYVSTHLALTSEGLYVLKDNSGWKVLITNNGVYIQNPSGATVAIYSAETTIGNALLKNVYIDSNGIYVRNGSANLAEFTGSSAQIGQSIASHTVVDSSGMRVYASDGSTLIADLGYGEGATGSGTSADLPFYTFGRRRTGSVIGGCSFAEGEDVNAYGYMAHAEGVSTSANHYSHAEGNGSTASGVQGAHAEGYQTTAYGTASHSQNRGTIANGNAQTALGKYNVADTTNAVIIGNGTADNARANALTVDWNGILNASGVIAYGVCATSGAVDAKTVTVSHSGFKLVTGSQVLIKFTNANTVASPTLNVNGTGAKAIRRYGTTAPSTSAASSWNSGSVILLIYDGTDWQMVGFLNSTYSTITDAEYQAGTSTSSRLITPARLKSAILYHATPTNTGAMPSDYFIWDTYSKSITVTGSGAYNFTMGTLTQHSGYTLRGYINQNGGYTDQWLVSYGTYGSNVVAMVYSKYGASLTSTISCTAIWTKDL